MPQVEIELEVFTKDEELYEPLNRFFYALQFRLKKNIEDYILGDKLENIGTEIQRDLKHGSDLDRAGGYVSRYIKSKSKYTITITTIDNVLFFLEYGTGIYNEMNEANLVTVHTSAGVRQAMVPRFKKVFKFEVDGEIVYTPYIFGMMPVPIFRSSLFKLRTLDVKVIAKRMGLTYTSKIASDTEKVTIELTDFRRNIKGRLKDWMGKYGKKLRWRLDYE